MRLSIRAAAVLLSTWAATGQAAEKVYRIDAAASDVHWLVYKAGALSRLGHNHVIAAKTLAGTVTVNDRNLARSSFEIVIPVMELNIDDPALRAGLGADFSSVPTADDIAGTRRNMLSERVLDGDKFSTIRIVGRGPEGKGEQQTIAITVELLGRSVPLVVPTRIEVGEDRVEASGEFELNHADLGMQPFSVMMGALQVGEKLSFSYRVVARPAP
jgi:polyisoprenoid-binding protein YceI